MKGVRECASESRVGSMPSSVIYCRGPTRCTNAQTIATTRAKSTHPLFGSVPAYGTHSLLVQKLPFGPTHSLNCLHSFETHLRRLNASVARRGSCCFAVQAIDGDFGGSGHLWHALSTRHLPEMMPMTGSLVDLIHLHDLVEFCDAYVRTPLAKRARTTT
jgi:hypothetical protein